MTKELKLFLHKPKNMYAPFMHNIVEKTSALHWLTAYLKRSFFNDYATFKHDNEQRMEIVKKHWDFIRDKVRKITQPSNFWIRILR